MGPSTIRKKLVMANRMGKHREDKVRVQAYITTRQKAVFVVTAEKLGKTITDLILEGGETAARIAKVITSSGDIAPEYRDAVDIAEQMIIAKEVKKNER